MINSDLHNRLLRAWNSLSREGAFSGATLLFGMFLFVLGVWYGPCSVLLVYIAVNFVEWRVYKYKNKQRRIERELREMLS